MGNPIFSQETGGPGEYIFENVRPGEYSIQYVLPTDPGTGPWVPTLMDQGGDDTSDSDMDEISLGSALFTVASGDTEEDVDAGFFLPATIITFVWNDANGDGIQDGAGPPVEDGIAGEAGNIELIDNTTGVGAIDVTGAPVVSQEISGVPGEYTFENVRPGEYFIQYVIPADPGTGPYVPTLMDEGGDDMVDSDMDVVTLQSPLFTVASEDIEEDVDAGFNLPARITCFIWEDENGDGIQAPGEATIAGATATLMEMDGVTPATDLMGNNPVPFTPTGNPGEYEFVSLAPAEYVVLFDIPASPVATPYYPTIFNDDGDDTDAGDTDMDSDADRTTLLSYVIELGAEENHERVDAGFYVPGIIGDMVFCDKNGDGIFEGTDMGEGVENVVVTLINNVTAEDPALDADGFALTTTTDAAGMYQFLLVPPSDDYQVRFVKPNANFFITTQDVNGDTGDTDVDNDCDADDATELTTSIELASQEETDEAMRIDCGMAQLITIRGQVWLDSNMDDILTTETGVSGVTVQLLDAGGTVLASEDTQAMGVYEFLNVLPGEYIITIRGSSFSMGEPLNGTLSCDQDGSPIDIDQDDDGIGNDTSPRTEIFTLLSGCDPNDPPVIEYIDFCFEFDCDTPNPLAVPTCEEAMIDVICELPVLEGFCSRMFDTNSPGPQPVPLCPNETNTGAHNISWFGFVAGTGNYSLVIDPFACGGATGGNDEGVQIGVYTSCDFDETVFCNGMCNLQTVNVPSTDFVPGETYYIFIDGCNSSVCSYTIEIQGNYGPPTGFSFDDLCIGPDAANSDCNDLTTCEGMELNFVITGDELELDYSWSITTNFGGPYNGDAGPQGNDNFLPITFENPGEYTVCMDFATNGCADWATPLCRTVTIEELEDEDFGTVLVCAGDAGDFDPVTTFMTDDPNLDGEVGWLAGVHTWALGPNTHEVMLPDGCIYEQTFTIVEHPESDVFALEAAICPGEVFPFGGAEFNENSFSDFELIEPATMIGEMDQNGCDSLQTLRLELLEIIPNWLPIECETDGILLSFEPLLPLLPSWTVTYTWSGPGGDIPDDNDGDGDNATIYADQGSGIYMITAMITTTFSDGTTKTCEQSFTTIFDAGAFLPTVPVVTGDESVCAGAIGMYTATSATFGVDYLWDVPAGAIITTSGANDEMATIDWSATSGGNILVTTMNGCGTSDPGMLDVTIVPQPTGTMGVTPEVCIDSVSAIVYTGATAADNFTWDFDGGVITNGTGGAGPGAHNVTWPTAGTKYITMTFQDMNGCLSSEVLDSVIVQQPLAAPVVTCSQVGVGVGEVIFTWNDIVGATYEFEITNPATDYATATINGNMVTVTGVPDAGTIELILTTTTGTACNTLISVAQSCFAQDCNPPTVTLEADFPEFCLNDTDSLQQQLILTILPAPNPAGSGTIEYSGAGVDQTGMFDATAAGVGVHSISVLYTDVDGCVGSASTMVTVKEVPMASFTPDMDSICILDQIMFMYTGTDNPTEFIWDFGDADNISGGTGPMPSVGWPTDGEKTVRLTVTKDGCTSNTFDYTVKVQPEVEPVVVSCIDQEDTSVTFGWNTVAGANSYSVSIDGGAPTVVTVDTFLVDGLAPLDMVTIVVTPILDAGVLCPAVPSDPADCIALDCPDFTFLDMTVDTLQCLTGATISIPLLYSITDDATGMDITNTLIPNFNGNPDVNPQTSTFAPGTPTPGTYNIQATFTQPATGCTVAGSFTIILLEQPEATFTVSDDAICITEGSVLVNFTGSGLGGNAPDWNISGGTIAATANSNEYEWTFDSDGSYTIDLEIMNDMCVSTAIQQTVEVTLQESIGDVMCMPAGLGEMDITWDAVSCATEYTIFVDGTEVATQTGTSYTATGLFEGAHDFVVQATSDCECDIIEGMNNGMCIASGCAAVVVTSITAPTTEWCINGDNLDAVTIDVTTTGGDGSGTVTWVGGNDDGTFSPMGLGEGSYTVTYSYQEPDCPMATDSIMFTIFGAPMITPMPVNPICFTDDMGSVTFDATGGMEPYNILVDGMAVSPAGTPVGIGNHTLEIIDANGCSAESSFNIVAPDPVAFADSDITGNMDLIGTAPGVFAIDPALFGGVQIDSIVWASATDGEVYCSGPDCFGLSQSFLSDETIEVFVFYNGGCMVMASFDVTVQSITIIDVTNIITPNGDTQNDGFVIFTNSTIQFNNVMIYDRWGNQVQFDPGWTGPGTHTVWDGRFDGQNVQPGVYVYTMEYVEEGVTKRRSGDITVVR